MSILESTLVTIEIFIAIFILLKIIIILISRPPKTLGIKDGKLQPNGDVPNWVSTFAEDETHKIQVIQYSGSISEVKQKILEIIRNTSNTTIISTQENYVHSVFKTALFGFRDDVEFLFDDNNKIIHFKSGSRIGPMDLGTNRKRMENIRQQFLSKTPETEPLGKGYVLVRDISANSIKQLYIGSIICSTSLFLSYLLWLLIDPEYFTNTGTEPLVVVIFLSIVSFGFSAMILKLQKIKPFWIPTAIWVTLIVIYAIISEIYLLILPAIAQLIIDYKFYAEIAQIIKKK